jgi:hypothetical protein
MSDATLISIPRSELEALLDQAAERGAKSALASVGLSDESAGGDVRDLRALIASWRIVQRGALQAIGNAFGLALLGAIAAYVAMKIGALPR